MKKAGAKNDGAWFRSNKVIVKKLTISQKNVLAGKIATDNEFADATFADLQSLAADAGLNESQNVPTTLEAWVNTMMLKGIPRQIWNGRLTTTTYSKVDNGTLTGHDYIPNYSTNIGKFAKQMRKTVRDFIFLLRETNDVFDIADNNPGGLPNADPES